MTPKRSSTQDGYGYRWQQASKRFLRGNPLCERHAQQGKVVPATQVDHRRPHKGDQTLFWDEANWAALCASCHSIKTATEDRGCKPAKPKPTIGRDGWPIEPAPGIMSGGTRHKGK
jgi:5-methylcytosine-specific restriction protein A